MHHDVEIRVWRTDGRCVEEVDPTETPQHFDKFGRLWRPIDGLSVDAQEFELEIVEGVLCSGLVDYSPVTWDKGVEAGR